MATAPALPLSLSPHVCVFPSPDLVQLLASASLPPLPRLLQSFTPIPQVTTRTTTLIQVSHARFPLRFSSVADVEAACKEDEEARAGRAIDWIGQRIAKRAASWVEHAEREGGPEAPWWEELRRCTEGDRTPARMEGWNHPVAIILAVSTSAPNPLQAVMDLHSRRIDLPAWVDPTMLRHTLIIQTPNSPLNDDEAMALFNATKKQYGLHTHLLKLSLSVSSNPRTLPSLLPELPPTPLLDSHFARDDSPDTAHSINLTEQDLVQLGRFVREFVTMSLVPWMERCVLDWNESFSSNRRLPSRLFSSTRRLFGGASSSYSSSASSTQSLPTTGSPTSPTATSFAGPPPQQRRLAEFSTILGDTKLAVSVWESLRKEGNGGSEMLPLLLAPSPALGAHAAHALSTLQGPNAGPSAQFHALVYAVRWGSGIRELSSMGGERWLEWAAGFTEEPPPAILLARAALLCSRRGLIRRSAMLYVFAAHRLEKCGIRPLTMYFLRKAHQLYRMKIPKNLSPSFDESHFKKDIDGFDEILPSIEYSLGRLMYTSGNTEGALRYFLGLLRGSSQRGHPQDIYETDALYIGDFRVAFEHYKTTVGSKPFPGDLKLPFSFSQATETKIRLARQGELDVDAARWAALEESWTSFWKSRGGRERLEKGGKAMVGERCWVDVMLWNPLDVEVTLANLTLKVEGSTKTPEVEVLDNVVLRAKESRVIPISIVSHGPGTVKIIDLNYSFLSLLPVTEPLSVRGPRLHQTAAERQNVTYGPDVHLKVEVEDEGRRLDVSLSNTAVALHDSLLYAGECVDLTLNIWNTGRGRVDDIWIVHSSNVSLDLGDKNVITPYMGTSPGISEVCRTDNILRKDHPTSIPLASLHSSSALDPNEYFDLNLVVHASAVGPQEIAVLLIFREAGQQNFYSTRLHRTFNVLPILDIGVFARPSAADSPSYIIDVEVENVNEIHNVTIAQVSTASANWSCSSVIPEPLRGMETLPPRQTGRVLVRADYWKLGNGSAETKKFALQQLGDVICGTPTQAPNPPPLDVLFSHMTVPGSEISTCNAELMESSKRSSALRSLAERFPQLPRATLPSIFPLRNPQTMDVIVFWEIPSEQRRGFITTGGLLLGAYHAPLDGILQQFEAATIKRTIYAEATREKEELLEAIRNSEWNAEMDPTVVRVVSEPRIEHDFSQKPCIVPVTFKIRNFSPTNHVRIALHLQSGDSYRSSIAQHLSPCYTGALTRRGAIAPLASTEIKTKMSITRPGIYGLGEWQLETEVIEIEAERRRTSFSKGPPMGDESIVMLIQRPS